MRSIRPTGTVGLMLAHKGARFGATAAVAIGAAVTALSACGTDTSATPPAPSTATSAPTFDAGTVSSERAGQIATDRFGGRVLNVEPDTAHGKPSWEVEIADSQQGRIEVDVSQTEGAVVEMERD